MPHKKIPNESANSKCQICGREIYRVAIDPSDKDMDALLELFKGNTTNCRTCRIVFCQSCSVDASRKRFDGLSTLERGKISAEQMGQAICPKCGGEAVAEDSAYV